MAQVFTVRLNRQDAQPWGFRLQGGKDFATPLVVQKVNGGSLAEQAGLLPGDAVIKINGTEVFSLKHKDAQDVIVRAGNNFDVTVQRGGSTWRPTVTPTGGLPTTKSHLGNNVPAVTKTSLAHKPQEVRHIGSGFNSAARPFSTINGNDGQVKSIVNKQYNTPVGIYSEEAIAETLSAQAEVLAGGVLGVNFKKNERVYNAANSEVLKMLHEQECDPSEPAEKSHGAQPPFFSQANQQSVQQQQQQQHHYQQQHQQHQTVQHSPQPLFNHQPSAVERSVVTRHVTAPVAQPKAPGTGGLPTGQNICSECERLIVGVFVRIKDKNLHAECFKCSTCGASLKNQGYFNLNNKLYCDIHARLAALNNPPAGTEGYDPIPIKPSATLSANTISAALNAHGIHTNGTPSLVTAPTVNHDYDLKASNTTANSIKTKHTRNLSNGIPISSSSSSSSISSPNAHVKSASSSSIEKLTPSHSRNSSFDNDGIRSFGNPNNELDGILHKMPFSIPSIIIDPTSVINNGEDNLNGSVAYNNSNVSKGISPQEQNGFTTSNTNINIANNGGNIQKEKTLAYNQFLKEYAKKKSNSSDKIDGENNKSFCSTASETPFSLTSNETMMSANDMNLADDSNNSCSNTNLSSNGHNEESIYGSIRSETKIKPNEEFQYVTLQGNLIKSVIPPGKGIETSYKVNQGFSGPKPFSPISPSLSGPKSPSSYPPPTSAPSWSSPVSAPKPATNPYATLPRATAPTGPASQGRFSTYKPTSTGPVGFNKDCSEEYYEETHREFEKQHYSEDREVAETNHRPIVNTLIWPPPIEEGHSTPTASPLYIPPPETQHVIAKPIRTTFEEKHHTTVEEQTNRQQWQSQSAPHLSTADVKQHSQSQIEQECNSDSYTSTSTTTTTTTDDYQRMYQAQIQAYQMQQMYDQYGSDVDYHMDMEVAAMQNHQEQAYSTSSEFMPYHQQSGRRSAQECAELISGPLSTYKLVDLVRSVTPSPSPTPQAKGPRKVEFADNVEKDKREQDNRFNEENIEKSCSKCQENDLKMCQEKSIQKCQENDTRKWQENEEKKCQENYVKICQENGAKRCQENKQTEYKLQTEQQPSAERNSDELNIERINNLEIQRKFQPTPEIKIEIPKPKPIPPSNIPNPIPKEWISPMVKALTTAPDKPVEIYDVHHVDLGHFSCKSDETSNVQQTTYIQEDDSHTEQKNINQLEETQILNEKPAKGSFITSVMSTAPSDPVKFTGDISELVPLPEETEPYMPPPMDMKPYMREDFRPKSPLLRALMTAPDTPFTPFGHDVCAHFDDLPTPKKKLTMLDALTVASNRCYTPLNPENVLTAKLDEEKCKKSDYVFFDSTNLKTENSDLVNKENENSSIHLSTADATESYQHFQEYLNEKASTQSVQNTAFSYESTRKMSEAKQNTYQQHFSQSSSFQNISSQSIQSSSCLSQNVSSFSSTSAKSETQTTKSQETEKKSLAATVPSSPKPKKALQSGLHKADNIPQYQRNWTVLPSQRPVKTPEPAELRENVPLAFVDVPKESSPSVQKPVAVQANVHSSTQNSTSGVSTSSVIRKTETKQPSTPSVPIIIEDRSGPISMTFQSIDDLPEDHSHCHPRPFTPSLINKPAPMVPFYQTEEKLVFEECSARTSQPFDRRSVSPVPDRAKSPAPGPPPNPLSAIRQSRMADHESNAPRTPQAGSITTGQSYLGVQQSQQQQQFHQNQNTSCYQTTSQSGYKNILDKPEVIQERRIGDTTIEKREKERRLNEEQKSQTQSRMVTHVGNVQIERQRKVVEEYEHSQTAKTIEIRKSSGNETRNVGKGFVTNQARRLSGLEQEITNLTSQSQAISARAANLGGQFEEDSRFPEYKSPEAVSKFPVKSALPAYDEPQRPTYIISGGIPTQTIGPPPGFKGQSTTKQKENISTSFSYDASSVSQISSSSNAAQGFIVASGFSNTNVSNMSSATSTNAAFNQMNTNAISVPAFKASVSTQNINNSNKLTIEAQQQKQNELQFNNANNTYKPTPSSGATGFKPPQQLPPQEKPQAQKSSNIEPSVNVSDPNPASAGPSKGSYGATSAPKRGRGILNKAVGPGARVPLCGSCNTQVSSVTIPVPPPPPPLNGHNKPLKDYKKLNSSLQKNGNVNHTSKSESATKMLANSVEKLNVNNNENFRFEASKILSNMLEARLKGKAAEKDLISENKNKNYNNNNNNNDNNANYETSKHPMEYIINLSDSNGNMENNCNGNHAGKNSTLKIPNGNGIETIISNGKEENIDALENEQTSVIFRNKPTNSSAKRELTTHASDRRSYIEKSNNISDSKNANTFISNDDVQQANIIANNLSNGKHPICCHCNSPITRGPFITALGRIWCPDHFVCVNGNCRRALQDIGFVEEKGDLYCEYCFEKFLAPNCSKCNAKIKGDCLNAIGKHFHPECFTCTYCGKLFGNSPFFLEEGEPYCEADWNELFTTKCFACGFPIEAGDRWVEALNHNYHSQCFNCTTCKKNLEGQSFYNKGGRPFCKTHAR